MMRSSRPLRIYAVLLLIVFAGVAKVCWTISGFKATSVANENQDDGENVKRFAVSADKKLLATISFDGTSSDILVRDFATRDTIHRLNFQGQHPVSVAFHPTENCLLSSYQDGHVVLWDLNAKDPFWVILGQFAGGGSEAVFSPDGRKAAAGNVDGAVAVWDYSSREREHSLTYTGRVFSLHFVRNGQSLLAAGLDGGICLWNLADGSKTKFQNSDRYQIRSAQPSRDGSVVLSGGLDGTMRWWNVADGKQTRSRPIDGHITCVRFTSGDRDGICGDVKGNVSIVSFDESVPNALIFAGGTPISQILPTDDGRVLISSYCDGVISCSSTLPSGMPLTAAR